LAKTEKSLDFDSMLEPKANASQMNGDEANTANGRPKKRPKDASDSTNKVNDTQ
jgi:hypothetical protein